MWGAQAEASGESASGESPDDEPVCDDAERAAGTTAEHLARTLIDQGAPRGVRLSLVLYDAVERFKHPFSKGCSRALSLSLKSQKTRPLRFLSTQATWRRSRRTPRRRSGSTTTRSASTRRRTRSSSPTRPRRSSTSRTRRPTSSTRDRTRFPGAPRPRILLLKGFFSLFSSDPERVDDGAFLKEPYLQACDTSQLLARRRLRALPARYGRGRSLARPLRLRRTRVFETAKPGSLPRPSGGSADHRHFLRSYSSSTSTLERVCLELHTPYVRTRPTFKPHSFFPKRPFLLLRESVSPIRRRQPRARL